MAVVYDQIFSRMLAALLPNPFPFCVLTEAFKIVRSYS